jgi:hypothetical protein
MANFAATDLFIPVAGHVVGAGGTEFFTTVWISNPLTTAVDVELQFLRAGQANDAPLTVHDSLAPGQSRTYENIADTLFHISGTLGALMHQIQHADSGLRAHLQPAAGDAAQEQ